jgi:hypothetical protein
MNATRRVVCVLLAVVVYLLGAAVVLPGPSLVAAAQTPDPQLSDTRIPEPISAPPSTSHELIDIPAALAAGVSRRVLELATSAVGCAVKSGDIGTPRTLTLIDYSRPSTEPRLWVFDLVTGQLRFRELVAHGQGTGENLAVHFSDDLNSHQSSLGLFVTRDTYIGNNGYSLRLDGLEPGFNSRARERVIVMHGAPYVDAVFAAKQGRLGRSWGCPALREAVAHQVIDFVRNGGVVFAYYPDQAWLQRSRFLNCPATATITIASN